MSDISDASNNKRNIWMRGLFMLLMALALHVCETVLCIVIVIQFVIVLLNDASNERLVVLGRNLGSYFRHKLMQKLMNGISIAIVFMKGQSRIVFMSTR